MGDADLQLHLFDGLGSERELLAVAAALLPAGTLRAALMRSVGLDGEEDSADATLVTAIRAAILAGADPLGDAYCRIHAPDRRRAQGQTFTPQAIVANMLEWAGSQPTDVRRIVDPGAGSGRFTLAALRRFPNAYAVAVELDPILVLLLHANLWVTGLAERAEVVHLDFRELNLPRFQGCTLFVGNPPYVRHHDIELPWKRWYSQTLRRLGHQGSQLAGLHLHFFAQTALLAHQGDLGCYVTSAEWLDVNYGRALRELLADGLGGQRVLVADPTVPVFGDALVSAAITCFAPGLPASIEFGALGSTTMVQAWPRGESVDAATAKSAARWSPFFQRPARAREPGQVELGELFRVSRGQVTGLNRVWVVSASTPHVPPRFLTAAVTDASDITDAPEATIFDALALRRVVELPADLAILAGEERCDVERFLAWARAAGAHEGYVAKHRRPWWCVRLPPPAPIVMTYMGRRPPVFAINRAGAGLINVAHGLYPRKDLPPTYLLQLVHWMNRHVSREGGRTYAGGLTKFEPSEAMRILVPAPDTLAAASNADFSAAGDDANSTRPKLARPLSRVLD